MEMKLKLKLQGIKRTHMGGRREKDNMGCQKKHQEGTCGYNVHWMTQPFADLDSPDFLCRLVPFECNCGLLGTPSESEMFW